jgi:hypothetical protein
MITKEQYASLGYIPELVRDYLLTKGVADDTRYDFYKCFTIETIHKENVKEWGYTAAKPLFDDLLPLAVKRDKVYQDEIIEAEKKKKDKMLPLRSELAKAKKHEDLVVLIEKILDLLEK